MSATFRPNDAKPGDVLVWWNGKTVILVVEVNREEKRLDSVVLVQGEKWLKTPGSRVSTTYSAKNWKRFNPDFRFLSRSWVATLCPENASHVGGGMMGE